MCVCVQAYHGHAQALEVLLQGETEVDQGDEAGRTPLALAALRGHTDCVHTLLSQGASPRTTDTQHGRTPVHLAGGSSFSLTSFADSLLHTCPAAYGQKYVDTLRCDS